MTSCFKLGTKQSKVFWDFFNNYASSENFCFLLNCSPFLPVANWQRVRLGCRLLPSSLASGLPGVCIHVEKDKCLSANLLSKVRFNKTFHPCFLDHFLIEIYILNCLNWLKMFILLQLKSWFYMRRFCFVLWLVFVSKLRRQPTQLKPLFPFPPSHNNFVAILDLPEGEHQYKFYVDGQWTHDPSEVLSPRPPSSDCRTIQMSHLPSRRCLVPLSCW